MTNETDIATEQNNTSGGERLSKRNFFMFPLGTLGRDFLYNFFNGYLLSFVLFTKTLTVAQFSSISIIIVLARIFDALNDPLMGGIVENTRTKWGKYKPWQLIGAVSTSVVIVLLFNVNLDGWAFIAFLAVCYFLFSITFTMNDISYWGMLPSLTSNVDDRNKLTSFTQIICGLGIGLSGLLVPALTTGAIGTALFGSAIKGYKVLSIVVSLSMLAFQCFTLFGVKEKPLPELKVKTPPMKIKDMFKVLFKNDQLLWASLILLLYNIGVNVFSGGLGMMYSYIEFGYDGLLWTVFAAGFSVVSTAFTLFYPLFSKKWGRDKTLYSTGIATIIGFLLMLLFGLVVPKIDLFVVPILNVTINLKYLLMMLAYTIAGWGGGFYLICVINITNTVEYNEYKTGDRKEGLIFSLRPFTAKMGSALMQGIISLVYIIAGVLAVTDGISSLENKAIQNEITAEEKLISINNLIDGVPEKNKIILLVCMCIIPVVFMAVTLIIYKKKFKLDEKTMDFMLEEIKKRKESELSSEQVETSESIPETEKVETSESIPETEQTEVFGDEPTEIDNSSTQPTPEQPEINTAPTEENG